MNLLKKFASLGLLLSLCACASAEIVKRIYQPAPGGIVKYEDGWMGEKSRVIAMQKMEETCMGKGYTITSESRGNELGAIHSSTSASGQMAINQSQSKVVNIEFTCKK